ncbi:restriction endonuclease subunit S [Enterobacter hormaechei]|uniref:restriction endonuclease subunit S n=1 Tax=Enterobacter hormaechei TaxID=158836 RepID=UPI002237D4CC|nr:restriction endonuclease subunit S [Enterobacter hormaechei]MCW4908549.1 restriction endonuclease subunit S [Enterobacter hormaechei subsp. xiangfangensis]
MAKYKAYPEYKDSDIEWLGKIPSGWLLKKAKYIFQRVQRPLRDIDGVVTAFRDGQVTLRTNRRTDGFTNSVKEIGYQGVRRNDLVIHAMDGFAGAIGVSDSDGKCSPVCSVCIPWQDQPLNMRFYGYLVRQLAVTDFILSLAKGIRERSTEFRFNEFSGLMLPIPPVYEQDQIAKFLDHETAKIDNLIEKQQQLIELLKEKRQAVISHAVTKGLNPDVPMKDSGVEWLGEVPDHWELVPLKYLCNFSGGGTPTKDNLSYWQGGTVPWVSPKDMKSFWISETQDYVTPKAVSESSTNYIEEGSLLMVVRSGILQRNIPVAINIVKVTMNQDMKALRFNERMKAHYAAYFINGNVNSLLLEWTKEGATVESIEHEYLANGLIPVPPIDEQHSIIKSISGQMIRFELLEEKALTGIRLLQERRTALISAAITGKIDVRDWVAPDTQDVEEPQEATA